MSKVTYPIFHAYETFGLPLDTIISVAMGKGHSFDWALTDFVLGAARAGWAQRKVRSAVREVISDLTLEATPDQRWAFWADGAFDEDTRCTPQS